MITFSSLTGKLLGPQGQAAATWLAVMVALLGVLHR